MTSGETSIYGMTREVAGPCPSVQNSMPLEPSSLSPSGIQSPIQAHRGKGTTGSSTYSWRCCQGACFALDAGCIAALGGSRRVYSGLHTSHHAIRRGTSEGSPSARWKQTSLEEVKNTPNAGRLLASNMPVDPRTVGACYEYEVVLHRFPLRRLTCEMRARALVASTLQQVRSFLSRPIYRLTSMLRRYSICRTKGSKSPGYMISPGMNRTKVHFLPPSSREREVPGLEAVGASRFE